MKKAAGKPAAKSPPKPAPVSKSVEPQLDAPQDMKYSPIAQMMNWNEVIKKENKNSKIFDQYYLNPHSLHIYSEKPNLLKKPTKEEEAKPKDPKTVEVEEKLRAKIIESQLTPKMKYKTPVTASQEIGWSESKKFNKAFQSYNLTSCPETLFGSSYFALKGIGLYSNKNNIKDLTKTPVPASTSSPNKK